VTIGALRRIRVLASDVSLAVEPGRSTILNVLPARILTVAPSGEREMTAVWGSALRATALSCSPASPPVWICSAPAGMSVHAQVKAVAFAPDEPAAFVDRNWRRGGA